MVELTSLRPSRRRSDMHADLVLLQAGKSLKRLRVMERQFRQLTRLTAILTVLGAIVTAGWLYQRWQTTIVAGFANREAARLKFVERRFYMAINSRPTGK